MYIVVFNCGFCLLRWKEDGFKGRLIFEDGYGVFLGWDRNLYCEE